MTPAFDEVHAIDFPGGVKSYTQRDTDMAGRFQNSKHQARGAGAPIARQGMSIDERLPMKREEERRQIDALASAIQTFLGNLSDSSWDFAASPAIHNAVLAALPDATRRRLRQTLTKDLVNQPTQELAMHFAER